MDKLELILVIAGEPGQFNGVLQAELGSKFAQIEEELDGLIVSHSERGCPEG